MYVKKGVKMSKVWVVVIGLVALAIGAAIYLKPADTNKTSALTFASVAQDVAAGAKLYDVRTPDEFATSHFEGAKNWSLQDMQQGKLPDTPKDTKLYVYCHSGNRSGQATQLLEQAGYSNVTDLGGLPDVEAIGGKLVTN